MLTVWSPKGSLPGVPCVDRGNWEWECNSFAIRNPHNLHNDVLCEDRFAKTDAAHLTHRRTPSSWETTLNDIIERFRNAPFHKFYSLKAEKLVHTSSHEIANEPYVSSNYKNTTKTVTADLTKTRTDVETSDEHLTCWKNQEGEDSEHNVEGGANSVF